MCAILDANVAGVVFGPDCGPAGREFRRWIEQGTGRLAVGGLLRRELSAHRGFQQWLRQALLSGRAASVSDEQVDRKAKMLQEQDACRSDDEHVLALASLSGARLLYSRDRKLQRDFKDPKLLNSPRGKVYPEQRGAQCRRWLQRQPDLCADRGRRS